jgi:HEAT repeats
MHEHSMAPRFLQITKDSKDPLAPAALIALGDLGELQAMPAVREALDSRSEELVVAAARAAGKLIKRTGTDTRDLRDKLAALLTDSSATEQMRIAALESLLLIDDPRLNAALASSVMDAGLEGTYLLERIEELLRERKVRLAAQPGARAQTRVPRIAQARAVSGIEPSDAVGRSLRSCSRSRSLSRRASETTYAGAFPCPFARLSQ